MKKASIIVTTIIVIAIIAGTLVILSIVSTEVFGGISILWLSQNSCASLNALTEKMDISCDYGYDMVAEINIPAEIENFKIMRFPRSTGEIGRDLIEEHGETIEDAEIAREIGKFIYGFDIGPGGFAELRQALSDAELTGYLPDVNSDYEECRGGICICMVKSGLRKAPRTQNCDYCYAVARQSEPPAFCCNYGVCRFRNVGNIPDVNSKFVATWAGEEERETKIFDGLTFIRENKTDNLTWIQNYCTDTIYDDGALDGVFIIDSYGYTGEEGDEAPSYICGNGEIDDGEECDGDDTPCDPGPPVEVCNNCRCTTCGNDVYDVGVEDCDYDVLAGDYVGICVGNEICNNCECTTCGNGVFEAASEECETTADCPLGTVCDSCQCASSIFSGCCFREDRLVGPCVRGPLSAQDNKDTLVDFVSFSQGSWPLKGRVSVEIHANALGGMTLRLGEYRLWWQL